MYRSRDNCGDTDEDTDKDDECRDTKPSKNMPPSFRFLRLENHTTRRTLNSNWTATCNLFLPSIEGSLPETLPDVNRNSEAKTRPQKFLSKIICHIKSHQGCVLRSDASNLVGLGLRCVGQPALDPLDLSVVIRFVFAHVEPLAIIICRSPNPVVVDLH